MSTLRVVFYVCAKTCLSSVWSAAFYPDHWFPRHSTACHSGRTWQSACGKMDPLLASRLVGTLTTTTNTTPRLDHHHLNQHQIISSNSIINLTIFAHLVATPIFQPLLDSPTHRHLSNMQFCFTPISYFSFSSKFQNAPCMRIFGFCFFEEDLCGINDDNRRSRLFVCYGIV